MYKNKNTRSMCVTIARQIDAEKDEGETSFIEANLSRSNK